MKVAHLVSNSVVYPLKKHNGRYDWVLRLAQLQAKAGLQPVIYSNPASFIDIPGVEWRSIPEPFNNITETNLALMKRAMADPDIDIFHSHLDFLHYRVAGETEKPVIFTQHWFPYEAVANAAQDAPPNVWAVPVTHFMAEKDADLHIRAVAPIYHGIDLDLFCPSDVPHTDRLLFVGRIAPHKGVREAVEIARQAGTKLDIIGKLNDKDRAYWDSFAGWVDDNDIRYLGPKPQTEVAMAMQQAKALLFPGQHIEAFGQTIVEAQACGTPVITSDVGANSELLQAGETGFLAKNTAEFVEAMTKVGTLDSSSCRKFAQRFDIHQMVTSYTELYEKLLENNTI